MFGDVSIGVAFLAGVLSFFSPCILPLIPAYLMYISGSVVEDDVNHNIMIIRTLSFIVGFTVIFLIMGASASLVGRFFVEYKEAFSRVSGILIILFGLNLLGILKLNFLSKVVKPKSPKSISNVFGSFLMGLAFASGWTPCFGPVLASILFYASSSASIGKGILLLGIYSLGMAIPFLLSAIFFTKAMSFLSKTEKYAPLFSKIAGGILVIFGILIFFDKVIVISGFFLDIM